MDASLIAILVRDVLIPEIGIVYRAHHNAGLPPPTDDQVIAALQADADRYIAVADRFLARTAPPPAGPLG